MITAITRRRLIELGMAGIAVPIAAACGTNQLERSKFMIGDGGLSQGKQASAKGRILARPKPLTGTAKLGLQPLGLDGNRDAVVL
ncbi:MAG TPA: hypothetical protein V6D12_20805 [Candidatus Obscuribacterales bacterium]